MVQQRLTDRPVKLRYLKLMFGKLTEKWSSPHGTAQLLISHAAIFLLLAPHLSHSLGLEELEHPFSTVLPLHQTLVLLWVNQDVSNELPQVSTARSCGQEEQQVECI